VKRTRRIEITRYRRKVTVSQDEPSAAEIAEVRWEEDSILNVLQSLPPLPKEVDSHALVLKDVESECLPRWSLLRLPKLLQSRKRT
jgi:hypothetical protein